MLDNLEHEHIWDYFKVSTYKKKCIEELYVRKCCICDKSLQINEEEYLENCFLHIDDLYFSYN